MTGLYGPSAGIIADTLFSEAAAVGAFLPNGANEYAFAEALSVNTTGQGFFHAWVRVTSNATTATFNHALFTANSGSVAVTAATVGIWLASATGQFSVRMEDGSNNEIFNAVSSKFTLDGQWHQLMASWNTLSLSYWMSIDGVRVTSFNGSPTMNPGSVPLGYPVAFGGRANVMISPNLSADFASGGDAGDGAAEIIFCTSWLGMTEAHGKLRTPSGKPAFVGSQAQVLFGAPAQFYFTSPRSTSTPNSFWANNGAAGTFTASGGCSLATTSPAD